MTAFFVSLKAMQPPFDDGVDDAGRAQVTFNVIAEKAHSLTFIEELFVLLGGVATVNVTMFATAKSKIPVTEDDTAILSIRESGGAASERTQNQISPPTYVHPTAQIKVRSHSYVAARAMSVAAYLVLDAVRNTTVTTV